MHALIVAAVAALDFAFPVPKDPPSPDKQVFQFYVEWFRGADAPAPEPAPPPRPARPADIAIYVGGMAAQPAHTYAVPGWPAEAAPGWNPGEWPLPPPAKAVDPGPVRPPRTTASCVDGEAVYIAHLTAAPGDPAAGTVRRFDPAAGESRWLARLELPARGRRWDDSFTRRTWQPFAARPEFDLAAVRVCGGQVVVVGSWHGELVEWRFDAGTGRPLGRVLPAFVDAWADGTLGPAYHLVRVDGFEGPPDTTAGLDLVYQKAGRFVSLPPPSRSGGGGTTLSGKPAACGSVSGTTASPGSAASEPAVAGGLSARQSAVTP